MALGTLTIDLAANTARLSSDLGKASRLSEKYAEDAKRRAERAGKIIGTAVAGLATGAFAGWIKSSIDAADAASKTAASVGVTIETLTGLQFAAGLSGVATNELTSSLSKFNKTIDQAARGSVLQAEAFADIGVAVRDSNGDLKSADQLLLEVSDKFAGYENGAAKAALAQELFGKSGAKLIPLLNSGSDGITKLTDQARKLGLVIDQETATAAENFNDSLSVLGSVSDGIANQVSADLLPVLNDFTGLLIDISTDSDAASSSADALSGVLRGLASVGIVIGAAFRATGQAIGATAAALTQAATGDFKAAWQTIKDGAGDYADTTEASLMRLNKLWSGDFRKSGEQAAEVNKKLKDSITRTNLAAEKTATTAKAATNAIDSQVASLQLQAETLGMTATQATLYKLALDGATESQLASAKAALEQVTAFDAMKKATEERKTLLEEISEIEKSSWSDASQALSQYQEQVETLRKGLIAGDLKQDRYDEIQAGLERSLDKTKETTDQMSEYAKSAAQNMQTAFADFLFNPFDGGTKGMLDSFATILQRMAAEAAAAQIFESIGDFGKSNSGAGGWAGLAANVASFFSFDGGGSTPNIPRSGGVDGKGGFWAVMHGNETVTDHTKGQRVPGGGAQVQNISFNLPGIQNAKQARQATGTLRRALVGYIGDSGRFA